jgi:hypothetical protein
MNLALVNNETLALVWAFTQRQEFRLAIKNEVAYNDMAICSVKAPESHTLFICIGSAIRYRES